MKISNKLLKILVIISSLLFALSLIIIPKTAATNKEKEKTAKAKDELIKFINIKGSNNSYSFSKIENSLTLNYSINYSKSFENFEIRGDVSVNNVEYHSSVIFDYDNFKDANFYCKVIVDENKTYSLYMSGITLYNCPNISNPTKWTKYMSTNWNTNELNINDYIPNCITTIQKSIIEVNNKIMQYNNNIKLW